MLHDPKAGPKWLKSRRAMEAKAEAEAQSQAEAEQMIQDLPSELEEKERNRLREAAMDVGPSMPPLEEMLAAQAVTAKEVPGKELVAPGETVEPIFDIGAAMPFFELAAEFGKSGRSTADSLAAAAQVYREGAKTRSTSAYRRALAEQARAAASVDFKGQKLSLRQAETLLKTYIAKQQAYLELQKSLRPAEQEKATKELERLEGDIDRLSKMYENALGLAPRTPTGTANPV